MTLFRVQDWKPGDPAPDLWKLLGRGVCRKPGDKRKRVAVADSKQLKLPNDTATRHPLVHLERGVLGFLRALAHEPATDADLFARLGVGLEDQPWYAGAATGLPLAHGEGELSIAASRIAGALDVAGVELLDVRCVVIAETELNRIIRETGSKGEATAAALGRHLRHIVEVWRKNGEQ